MEPGWRKRQPGIVQVCKTMVFSFYHWKEVQLVFASKEAPPKSRFWKDQKLWKLLKLQVSKAASVSGISD